MKALIRWGKFNLVGAMGMVVQLAALACFNRWMHGRYLLASAAAIELTLLHNFAWHWFYTWRDRRCGVTPRAALVQFHLSNGLVSLLGNLAMMRLLVHNAHVPLLVANVVAIGCCSLLNFWLGDRWAFAMKLNQRASSHLQVGDPSAALAWVFVLVICANAHAQAAQGAVSSSQIPDAPAKQVAPAPSTTPAYQPRASDSYFHNAGAFCGLGASTSQVGTKPTLGCGAGITFFPLPVFFEVGVMAPQANRSYLSGYISADTSIPLAPPRTKYLPLAILGYSRFFETGHAFDYGIALALPRPGKHKEESDSLRIELRDYWTFANPTQHNVMLRVGWMGPASD